MKNFNADDQPIEYFKKMKDIEEKLLIFLDKQDELNENFLIFNEFLQDHKLSENKYELKSFLYLIAAISKNYHRSQDFFTKIELILKSLQEKIKNYYHSFEIFQIFRRNKRLLLFLFQSEVISPNEEIYSIILRNKKYINEKYLEYFYPEFEPFFEEKMKFSIFYPYKSIKIDEFNKKREKGENDNYLCSLIQNDLVVDFITYLEKTNISPSSTIQSSIFETNLFLMKENPTLIEYSAFKGSIQIFKYLYQNNAKITTSIWSYAIHGRNAEIIHFLEEKKIETLQKSYQYLIFRSIKCHYYEMIDYFRNNFCDNEKIDDDYLNRKGLKYYNFGYFTEKSIQSLIDSCKDNPKLNIPYYLCKYDYFLIVEFLLKTEKISDLNYRYEIPLLRIPYNNIRFLNNDIEFYNRDNFQNIKYTGEKLTILNIATRKGNIDIIQLLLKMPKINVDIESTLQYDEPMEKSFSFLDYYQISENKSILHEAVESGFAGVVQFILKNIKFDINCKCSKNRNYEDHFTTAHMKYDEIYEKTLLHLAIERGFIEIIKLLLSNPNININLNSTSRIFEAGGCVCYTTSLTTITKSSLYFAIKNGRIKLIQLLLAQPQIDVEHGITKDSSRGKSDKTEKSPLYLAVEKQNFEIVQLLSNHPKINTRSEIEALELASELKNTQIYQFLSNYDKSSKIKS